MKEYSILELAEGLEEGKWTTRDLVDIYLKRIEEIDKSGPSLNSVSEINPDAYKLADFLDEERKRTGPRSVLHGIPILIKDNINTGDLMHTTASSYALKDFSAKEDSEVVKKLRDAGMLILGKTNLSEFAYFMSLDNMPSGYGSLNGQVKSPYNSKIDPLGSSTGSAVSVAANLIPVAIGTETNGSLTAPALNNSIVAIKPTLGLISRTGIIPISHLQDTAGPMGRTVEDVAILLEYLIGKDNQDVLTLNTPDKKYDFSETYHLGGQDLTVGFLKFNGVKYDKEELTILEEAKDLLKSKVKKILNIEIEYPNINNYDTLKHEFKYNINKYFSLQDNSPIKSLKGLIRFNEENQERCLKYGQSIFIEAENTSGSLDDKEYLKEREELYKEMSKFQKLMEENNIDVIITPRRTSHAPVYGNPVIAVPAKPLTDNTPRSLFFISKKFEDELCIRIAYLYEQLTQKRIKPNL